MVLGSKVTFVYFKESINSLLSAEYHLHCGQVRAHLKEKGIKSVQYLQVQLSSLYDTVDEIISLGNQMIVLYVEEQNEHISKIVTNELKQADSDLTIVWMGPFVTHANDAYMQESLVDVFVETQAPHVIGQLVENDDSKWESIPGAVVRREEGLVTGGLCTEATLVTESPYQHQLIPIEKVSEVGVELNKAEQTIEELDFIISKSNQPRLVIPILNGDLFQDRDQAEQLLHTMTKRNYPCMFQARIQDKDFSKQTVELLVSANIKWVELTISNPDEWIENTEKLNIVSESVFNLQVALQFLIQGEGDFGKALMLAEKLVANRITSPSGIRFNSADRYLPATVIEFYKKIEVQSVQVHEQSLVNGYISYQTGYYPVEALSNSVKHVGILESSSLTENEYFLLKDFTSLNSALIEKSDATQPEQRLLGQSASWVTKVEDTTYEQRVALGHEVGYYMSHLYQIHNQDNGKSSLQLDNFYRATPISVYENRYVEAEHTLDHEMQFLKVESSEDLEQFLANVDHFMHTGTFQNLYEVTSFLKDACRYSGANSCRLTHLPRFDLREDGEIYPCGGCSKSLGSLEDSYLNVLQNAFVMVEEEQMKRGCATCEVKDTCSKCAMLPSFMTSEEYCRIQKSKNYIGFYFQLVDVLKVLRDSTTLLKGIEISDLKVSTPFVAHYLSQSFTNDGGEQKLEDYVYHFIVRDTPVIFNIATRKILRSNEVLSTIFEGLLKKVPQEELELYLSEKYGESKEKVAHMVDQALESFKVAGLLKKGALV